MEQAIAFKSFQIPVFTSGGRQWVSIRHTCSALGVSHQTQEEKLKTSPEYHCQLILTVDAQGRNYPMLCIAAEHAHLWVAGISSAKIRPEIRDQFIAYKHECAEVIHNHFMQKGEDFLGLAREMKEFRAEINTKIDNLTGIQETVFGDDAAEIQELIAMACKKFNMTQKEYWGRVRRECDVSSYKQQNRKIKNFIRNDLGIGINLVPKVGECANSCNSKR